VQAFQSAASEREHGISRSDLAGRAVQGRFLSIGIQSRPADRHPILTPSSYVSNDSRSPRLRNPDQLRRGERYRPHPSINQKLNAATESNLSAD
jgi:hypothetical protein